MIVRVVVIKANQNFKRLCYWLKKSGSAPRSDLRKSTGRVFFAIRKRKLLSAVRDWPLLVSSLRDTALPSPKGKGTKTKVL